MEVQVVASLVVAAPLAIVPVHALVEFQKRRRVSLARVVALLTGVAVVAAAISLGTVLNIHGTIVSVLVMGLHVATMYLALRAMRVLSGTSVGFAMAALLFVVWVLPLGIELVQWSMFQGLREPYAISILGTMSPAGELIAQWSQVTPLSAVPGLLFQGLVVGGLWYVRNALVSRPKKVAPGGAVGAV